MCESRTSANSGNAPQGGLAIFLPHHKRLFGVPRWAGGLALIGLLVLCGPRNAAAQNELYVTNEGANSVTVYARTANGNEAPIRTIKGAATLLDNPAGLDVDKVNAEIVVVNESGNSVTVYRLTDNGNVAPQRKIMGAQTGLKDPEGLDLDLVNDEIAVVNTDDDEGPDPSVTVYKRTDTGNVLPQRTIMGAQTGLKDPEGVGVDTVNDEIVVTNAAVNSITVYKRTDTGNVLPQRTIMGAQTGLNNPADLAVDTVNNEIVVTNENLTITVYKRTDNGDVAPQRKITGGLTQLFNPEGVAIDTLKNEIFATNSAFNPVINTVTVYKRTDNGDVAPLRTLSGALTGLDNPSAVAVCSAETAVAPSLARWGLLGLAALLLGAGLWVLGRLERSRQPVF